MPANNQTGGLWTNERLAAELVRARLSGAGRTLAFKMDNGFIFYWPTTESIGFGTPYYPDEPLANLLNQGKATREPKHDIQ